LFDDTQPFAANVTHVRNDINDNGDVTDGIGSLGSLWAFVAASAFSV